jgi:hypothetical protein
MEYDDENRKRKGEHLCGPLVNEFFKKYGEP